jgi:hypothetical protein
MVNFSFVNKVSHAKDFLGFVIQTEMNFLCTLLMKGPTKFQLCKWSWFMHMHSVSVEILSLH